MFPSDYCLYRSAFISSHSTCFARAQMDIMHPTTLATTYTQGPMGLAEKMGFYASPDTTMSYEDESENIHILQSGSGRVNITRPDMTDTLLVKIEGKLVFEEEQSRL